MATLGTTSVGIATLSGWAANFLTAFGPFTATEDGAITAAAIYTAGNTGVLMTLGIYNDNAGVPGTLVCESAEVSIVPGDWTTAVVTGALVNGSKYWVGYNLAGSTFEDLKYDSDAVLTMKYVSSAYSAGVLPDPFPSSSDFGPKKVSAYLTYTPSAAPGLAAALPRRGRRIRSHLLTR